jgi:hypothetical protein
VRFPVWLTIGFAILVIAFGIHRIRLSFRSDEAEERAVARKGLYGMSRRRHRILGTLYLVLGGLLVATALGFNPFGSLLGPSTETPKKGTEPTEAPLPQDGLKR